MFELVFVERKMCLADGVLPLAKLLFFGIIFVNILLTIESLKWEWYQWNARRANYILLHIQSYLLAAQKREFTFFPWNASVKNQRIDLPYTNYFFTGTLHFRRIRRNWIAKLFVLFDPKQQFIEHVNKNHCVHIF